MVSWHADATGGSDRSSQLKGKVSGVSVAGDQPYPSTCDGGR